MFLKGFCGTNLVVRSETIDKQRRHPCRHFNLVKFENFKINLPRRKEALKDPVFAACPCP